MLATKLLAAGIVFTLAACAPILSRVPLVGRSGDLSAIAGKWAGEYRNPAAGRSGSIVFTFVADKQKAFGDVAMGPPLLNRNIDAGGDGIHSSTLESQILQIKFVKVDNGDVEGTLTAYNDPSCDCIAHTTFSGHLDDARTIRGTFSTTHARSPEVQTGTWKVVRQ